MTYEKVQSINLDKQKQLSMKWNQILNKKYTNQIIKHIKGDLDYFHIFISYYAKYSIILYKNN